MQRSFAQSGTSRRIGTVLLLAAVYFIAAKLGLMLASIHPSASPVWPPTGIALAAVLVLGPWAWPGIFLGAFLANLTTAGTAWTSAGIAMGNTLEALCGGFLVTKYANGHRAFERPQGIFKFAALAALVSTTVSATIGVTSLALGGFAPWARYGPIWITWWLGDATGALTVTPLILLWAQSPKLCWGSRHLLERGLFLLALLGVSWIVFGGWFPFVYLTVPFLVWSAFRFEPRETATVVVLFALIALWATVKGLGPFVGATRNESLLLLQAFMGIMILVALPLASIVAEREAAHIERARKENAQRVLAEAGNVLGASLDPEHTLTSVASLAVPALADWCAIDLVQDNGDLRRLVAVHRDPAKLALATELRERYPLTPPLSYGVPTVIRTRQPQLAPEISDGLLREAVSDPEVRDAIRGLGLRSAMVVPLVARDRVLGAMTFLSAESRRRYDQMDLALADELARRAAIAMDNARLHQAEQAQRAAAERRAQRIERLHTATATLAEAITREQVAVAAAQAAQTLGAHAAALSLLTANGSSLEIVGSLGYPEAVIQRWQRFAPDAIPVIAEAMRTGQVLWYESGDQFRARYPTREPLPDALRHGARAAVPVMLRGRAIGTLYMHFRERRQFDAEDLGFLTDLAGQCAQACERARLYDAERSAHQTAEQAVHRIQRLQAVTAALSEALTSEQVAEVILQHVVDELGAGAAAVSLRVDDARSLALVSAVGYSADVAERWRRAPGEIQPMSDAMRTGRVVWYDSWADFHAHYPDAIEPAEPARLGARAAVPLVFHGRAIGALYMNFREQRRFDDAELGFMLTLGRQCAQALDRSELYEAEKKAHEAAEEAAHRIQRLQAATAALSGALTPSQVAEVILTEGLRALNARAGVVYRLRENDGVLEMLHSTGYPEDVARAWAHNPLSEASPSAEAARTKAAVYLESQAAVLTRYPGLAGKINPHEGGRAFLPLLVGGRVIGVLALIFVHPQAFRETERTFIQALADQCAQALERSRLYEGQRTVADTLQQAFLPLALPEIPGIRISAGYLPAAKESEVGGDWYDAFALPDGRIALCVGDAVGHGLPAAVIMGQMRQCIRAAALDDSDPSSALAKANRVLVHSHGGEGMATVLFGILDPVPMVFTYASAGHPAPMLRSHDGTVGKLARGGLPLGIATSIGPETHEVALPPGALLVLYTDGLVEVTRDMEEGEAALRAAVEGRYPNPAADAAHTLLAAVLGHHSAGDDIAIMTIEIDAVPFDRFAMTVPADPGASRVVRQTLRRLATTLNLDTERFRGLAVAVGEAVSNVAEHAYGSGQGTVDVRAWREGNVLHVEVEDHGRWRAERDEGRGHGLRIMRGLVDDVKMQSGPSGTAVRLSLRLPEPAAAPAPPATLGPEVMRGPRPERHPRASSGEREGTTIPLYAFEIVLVQGVPVLEVTGDVDLENEDVFLQSLERAARRDRRAVVVSLARASYIDSRGVHALLRFGSRLATNRQHLLLVVPSSSLGRRILDIVGVSSAYPLYETVDEAIAETEKLLSSSSSA